MSKIYFLRTYLIGSVRRLRALKGQTFEDGTPIPTTLNTQSDKKARDEAPLGTTFSAHDLVIKSTQGNAQFLSVIGKIYSLDDNEYSTASQDDITEYSRYLMNMGSENEDADTNATTSAEAEEKLSSKSLLWKIRHDPQWKKPEVSTDGFYVSEEQWETVMTFMHEKDNLLITGPTGSGKTELIMLACRKQGIPCHKYNMGTMSDPMSAMLGVHRIKDGKSVFEQAQFLCDIQEPCVILLDELNRAPLTALNYLLSCLDGTRELRNDYVSPAQTVKVHPDCTFIATANIGGEYVGTNMIDPALNSRLFRMELSYIGVNEETDVLVKRYGISEKFALIICKIAHDIRKTFAKGELSTTVTTRQTLMAAKLVSLGYSVKEAVERIFLPYFEGTLSEGEKAVVNAMMVCR